MSEKSTIEQALENAMTYAEYRDYVRKEREEGRDTSGNTEDIMLQYTDLNEKRMNKWDKLIEIEPELKAKIEQIDEDEIWLVITEGWCGDAAHIVPVINAMCKLNEKVQLKLVLRDQNLELMDQYLTDGGRSIPKLIRLKAESLEEICNWGPRPEPAQELFMQGKRGEKPKPEVTKELQLWYGRDRGATVQKEFRQFFG